MIFKASTEVVEMTEAYWQPKACGDQSGEGCRSPVGRRCRFREGAQWQLGCVGGGSGFGIGVSGASFFCAISDP
jgi:hypothetical protein